MTKDQNLDRKYRTQTEIETEIRYSSKQFLMYFYCNFICRFIDIHLVTFLFPNGLDIWHQFTITVLSSVQNTIQPILLLKTHIRVNKYFTKRTIYVEMLMAQHLFSTYLVHAYN